MDWARKKSVRILGSLLFVLLLAVVAIFILFPADKIRDLALEQAQAKLGRRVSVDEVAVSLRGGLGVRLVDFVIHNPEGHPGEPLLRMGALDLKLALGPLLKKEIRVHRLVLDNPVLTMARLADGSNNFTFEPTGAGNNRGVETPENSATDAPPPLSIDNLALKDGLIIYSDATAAEPGLRKLQVAGLSLNLSLGDPSAGSLRAEGHLKAGRIVTTGLANFPELNAAMDFDLTWDGAASELDITRVEGEILDLPLSCSGQIITAEGSPSGRIKIRIADQPLVKLASFLPAELAGKIQGDRNSGQADATIDLVLTGDATAPVHTRGSAKIRDADLRLLQPFLPPEQNGILAGQGRLELDFEQKSGPPNYEGALTLDAVSYTDSDLVDELQDLDLTLKFTPDRFAIENCRAQFSSCTFDLTGELRDPFPYFLPPEMQGDAEIKTPHLSFDLHSERLDVDQLLPAASPTGYGGSGSTESSPKDSPANMEFPDLSCDGTFSADSLIYMQVPYTDLTGKTKLRNRILSIFDASGAVYQGTVEGQVDLDLRDLSDPTFTGRYAADNIEANHFLTRFSPWAGLVFGRCNMSGSFSTHGRDPETIKSSLTLQSDASIRQGKLVTSGNLHSTLNKLANQIDQNLDQELILADLASHISIDDGLVGLNDLSTSLGQFGLLTMGGSFGFNGDLGFAGQLELTREQTDLLFNDGGLLSGFGGLLGDERPQQLMLPLTVGGTHTNPRLKLDLGSVSKDLQNRVVKEQGENLEDEVKSQLNKLLDKWK